MKTRITPRFDYVPHESVTYYIVHYSEKNEVQDGGMISFEIRTEMVRLCDEATRLWKHHSGMP